MVERLCVIPDGILANPEPLSIAFWAYPRDISRLQRYVSLRVDSSVIVDIESDGRWEFENTAGDDPDFADADLNSWQHIIVTADGTTMKAYKNGAEMLSNQGSLSTENRTEHRIGINDKGNEPVDGKIDDFRIYGGKALSGSEASNLYNTGSI